MGASLKSTETTVALTRQYPFIYGAAGVHPSETTELNEENFKWLTAQCAEPKVVAVGEIGLDYYWEEPDHEIQKKWFIRQLELARSCHKPVIIHSRDAAKDTYDIMTAQKAQEIGGVIHCYSYSAEMALDYVKMGFYIGIGGVVTFKNGVMLDTFERVHSGSVLIDGTAGDDIGEVVLKDREMLSDNGIMIISVTLNKQTKEIMAGPEILTRGFVYVKDSYELINEIKKISEKIVVDNTKGMKYVEYNKIKNTIRDELSKYLINQTGNKPMIITVIQEI